MYIKDKWINDTYEIIHKVKPDIEEKKLKKYLSKKFEENFRDTEAKIYNSYDEEIIETTLANTLDWIQVEKPYISESGCFFKNRYKCRNLNAEIIRGQLDRRAILKKEMFAAKVAGDVIQAAFKNIGQANEKKRANSGYGAEGNSTSFLFNAHSAMSITAAGRSQLSVAGMCFENLFSNNVKFKNMDEFYVYMNNIINERKEWRFDIDEVVDIIPTKDEFTTTIIEKFDKYAKYDEKVIRKLYDTLGEKKSTRIYYKCNMRAFVLNKVPKIILKKIMATECEFIDPNEIPNEIAPELVAFTEIIMEFVGYKYQPFRYEVRMKSEPKDVVIVSDTDSNFLYLGNIIRYISANVLPIKLFRTIKDRKKYTMKLVNIFCVISSSGVKDALFNYLDKVNIEDDFKPKINMKNEFYFETVGVTFAKKSYFGIISRQEGFVYSEPKLEVKGVNFFKSTSTEKTTKFINDEILMKCIFDPKDGKIDIKKIIRKIKKYEQEMYDGIKNGDMGYYKKSIKIKTPDAYKNPMSTAYKSVYVWNSIADSLDRIELPSVITQVKINIKSKKNLAELANYPEVYEKFLYLMEKDKNLQKVDANGKTRFTGINSIALPYGMESMPEWLLAIIDIETIIADNMKLFTQLYRPLGFKPGNNPYNGSQIKYYTNIIKL